jgi:hypothetical protein
VATYQRSQALLHFLGGASKIMEAAHPVKVVMIYKRGQAMKASEGVGGD